MSKSSQSPESFSNEKNNLERLIKALNKSILLLGGRVSTDNMLRPLAYTLANLQETLVEIGVSASFLDQRVLSWKLEITETDHKALSCLKDMLSLMELTCTRPDSQKNLIRIVKRGGELSHLCQTLLDELNSPKIIVSSGTYSTPVFSMPPQQVH